MAPYRPHSRRSVRPSAFAFAAALLGAVALAACGGGSSTAGSTGSSAGGTSSSDTGGPSAVVASRYGTATLNGTPTRVVAMSWTDADLALQLGVVPVGVARNDTVAGGLEPWETSTISRLGGDPPTQFSTTAGDPIESIAALRPDLILATKDYNLDASHSQLSKVAPVLGYESAPNDDAWRADALRVGRALHREAAARRLLATTDRQIRHARGTADLAGATYTWAISPTAGVFYTINSTGDVSARFMSSLGMRLGPRVIGLPTTSIPGRAKLSTERADVLRADMTLLTGPPSGIRQFLAEPSVARAVGAGRAVQLSNPQAQAVGFPSAISLQWALHHLVPTLSARERRS